MRAFGLAVCVCHRVYGLVWFGCVCVIVCMGGCGGGGCLHTHPWIRRRDTEGFCVLYVQPLRTSTMYSLLSLSHTPIRPISFRILIHRGCSRMQYLGRSYGGGWYGYDD